MICSALSPRASERFAYAQSASDRLRWPALIRRVAVFESPRCVLIPASLPARESLAGDRALSRNRARAMGMFCSGFGQFELPALGRLKSMCFPLLWFVIGLKSKEV